MAGKIGKALRPNLRKNVNAINRKIRPGGSVGCEQCTCDGHEDDYEGFCTDECSGAPSSMPGNKAGMVSNPVNKINVLKKNIKR